MDSSYFFVLFSILLAKINGECSVGWYHFKSSCYLVNNNKLTWYEAYSYCKSNHADLVKVDNQEEETFVKNFARESGGLHFWLGARDEDIEGTWMWSVDNSEVDYSDWHPSEPNNFGDGEDCLELASDHNWQWNDNTCRTTRIDSICEKAYPGSKPDVIG